MSNKGPVSHLTFGSVWSRWSNVYRLLQAYTQFWFVPSFLRKEHSYHNRETRTGPRKNAYTTLHKWEREEKQKQWTRITHAPWTSRLYFGKCRSQWQRGLRRGSEDARLTGLRVRSLRGRGCVSLVNVVFCQAEISSSAWSVVQRSSTEFGVFECDCEAWVVRRPWPTRGCYAMEKVLNYNVAYKCLPSLMWT